jgi:hypothetical protein
VVIISLQGIPCQDSGRMEQGGAASRLDMVFE